MDSELMGKRILFFTAVFFLCVGAIFSAPPPADGTYVHLNPHEPVSIDEARLVQTSETRNVILMIGDGMGLSQVSAGLTANRGRLNLEVLKTIGFAKTQSADRYVTDSAASGTAIASGVKTRNGMIGMDPDGGPVPTILELAEARGLATGLIATSSVTHATPASFAAHQTSRNMEEAIALDLVRSGVDVMIGGGLKFFAERKDNLSLLDSLAQRDYSVHQSLTSMQKRSSGPAAVLLADNALPPMPERGDLLPKAAHAALDILDDSPDGFFLMIEGSQIDWGGHDNDPARIVRETLDFDRAVGVVLEFAVRDGNTLIIVTADHETGGAAVEGGSIQDGIIEMDFTSGGHTGVMVPVFAAGPGAERFRGMYENTEIFQKMKEALGL